MGSTEDDKLCFRAIKFQEVHLHPLSYLFNARFESDQGRFIYRIKRRVELGVICIKVDIDVVFLGYGSERFCI